MVSDAGWVGPVRANLFCLLASGYWTDWTADRHFSPAGLVMLFGAGIMPLRASGACQPPSGHHTAVVWGLSFLIFLTLSPCLRGCLRAMLGRRQAVLSSDEI